MQREIELKYKVDGLEPVRRALRAAGAEFRFTVLQSDCYFDTPARSLLGADMAIRLRRVRCLKAGAEKPDARGLLTFKGPRDASSRAKSREEQQTYLDDSRAMERILKACGLDVMLRVEKRRASYRLGRCLVELDELPLAGFFVEVEGPGEKAIDTIAKKLCLPPEPTRAHYIELLQEQCRSAGVSCAEVTFRRCRPRCPKRPRT